MRSKLLVHYSIMMTTMTLRRFGCALCMPYIAPYRSQFRPYNRAYAYQGLTAFASLSMAVSVGESGQQVYEQKDQVLHGPTG